MLYKKKPLPIFTKKRQIIKGTRAGYRVHVDGLNNVRRTTLDIWPYGETAKATLDIPCSSLKQASIKAEAHDLKLWAEGGVGMDSSLLIANAMQWLWNNEYLMIRSSELNDLVEQYLKSLEE